MKKVWYVGAIVAAVLIATSVGQRRHHVRPRFDDFPAGLPYISGREYGQPFAVNTGADYSLAADRLYAVPIQIHHPHLFTVINMGVQSGPSNGRAAVGIYLVSPDGLPGDLLVQGNSLLDLEFAVGISTISQVLAPGWYYLVVNSNDAWTSVALDAQHARGFFGRSATFREATHIRSTYTYDGVLPDPFDRTSLVYLGEVDGSGVDIPSIGLTAE